MKRKSAGVCALALGFGLVFLSACGGNGNAQPQKPSPEPPEESGYAVQDLTYEPDAGMNGVGGGKIFFSDPKESDGLTEYKLAWGAGGAPLKEYTGLAVFQPGEEEYLYELPEHIYIPREAEQIVVESYFNEIVLDTAVFDLPAAERSEKLYEFQAVSDFQLGGAASPTQHDRTEEAFRQIREISPDTSGIFVVGDMTDHGYAEEYEEMLSIIANIYPETVPDIYYAIGNHESYTGQTYEEMLTLFAAYTGNERAYYSVDKEGTKFIVLGSVKASDTVGVRCELGSAQLNWLEEQLREAGKDDAVFIFLHQPPKNTVSGSLTSLGQTWYGLNDSEDAALRRVLKNYPNATLFTGHTHWHLESEQPALFGEGKDANFFNTASVGYLWQGEGAGSAYAGSEGLFVEVYKDYVVVRGREFERGQWLSGAQYVFLQPSAGE